MTQKIKLKTFVVTLVAGAVVALSGCADHPHRVQAYQPNVPLTPMSVLKESRGVLKVCLNAEAFALDDGKTAVDKIAGRAIANCYPEVDTYARLNAGRTKTFHGQLLMFQSALEQAHRLANQAVERERAEAAAP